MSDSIIELIAKNRAVALAGITVANGYDNTIESVQRPLQDGQDFTNLPMILLLQGAQEKEREKTESLVYKKILFGVCVVTKLDADSDARSVDEVLNSLQADVERAWMADFTCGGYALDTEFDGTGEYEPREGQPDINRIIYFSVQYKHRIQDPKQQF